MAHLISTRHKKENQNSNKSEICDMFGSCFFKLLLRTIFKNIKNTILVFFKNCYYYSNLVFSTFFMFYITKKWKPSVLRVVFLFYIKNSF